MAGPSGTVTRTQILAGPGAIYSGDTDAVEPLDTAVADPPTPADFPDLGSTDGGLTITVNQSFFAIEVDQVADVVGRRLTSRDVQVSTSLSEATLDNLAIVLNDATRTSGLGFEKVSLVPGQAAMVPTERQVVVDGWAPTDGAARRRRFLARRVVSIENVESAWAKDGKYMLPVTFGAHFVDATTPPCDWIDEVAGV